MKYSGFALIKGKHAKCFKVGNKTYAICFWFITEIPF